MVREFQRSDEGMRVRTADGDDIGTIDTVEGSTAHVKPETNLTDSIRRRLGWESKDKAMYDLDHTKVASFEDDVVHLKD